MVINIALSLCFTVETNNIVKQLCCNKKIFFNNMSFNVQPSVSKKKLYNCVLTANGYFSSQSFLRCYPHLAQIKFSKSFLKYEKQLSYCSPVAISFLLVITGDVAWMGGEPNMPEQTPAPPPPHQDVVP